MITRHWGFFRQGNSCKTNLARKIFFFKNIFGGFLIFLKPSKIWRNEIFLIFRRSVFILKLKTWEIKIFMIKCSFMTNLTFPSKSVVSFLHSKKCVCEFLSRVSSKFSNRCSYIIVRDVFLFKQMLHWGFIKPIGPYQSIG